MHLSIPSQIPRFSILLSISFCVNCRIYNNAKPFTSGDFPVVLVWVEGQFEKYRLGSEQPETRKLHQVCCKLLPCCHQADIRMRSHRLLRLDDNKSAASCQQA